MTDSTEPARPFVTYEELAELESEFDDIETEISEWCFLASLSCLHGQPRSTKSWSISVRKQTILQAPLYHKRAALVSKIPNFWPLVIEQAPLDVDQFIQPSDSAVLASCLRSIDVVRFEVPPAAVASTEDGDQSGSPRSVSIKFAFAPNDWFHDEVLEKTFWFRRRAVDGWTGLVSAPVRIRWKGKGQDLTEGLTDVAYAAWEAEQKLKNTTTTADADDDHNMSSINATRSNGKTKQKQKQKKTHARETLPEHLELEKKLEESTEGSLSFFAWFGFRGRDVSAEESARAMKIERERREKIRRGEKVVVVSSSKVVEPQKETDDDDADVDVSVEHDDDEDDELSREIFPGGEDLAIAISEDLFPNAMKYFSMNTLLSY